MKGVLSDDMGDVTNAGSPAQQIKVGDRVRSMDDESLAGEVLAIHGPLAWVNYDTLGPCTENLKDVAPTADPAGRDP